MYMYEVALASFLSLALALMYILSIWSSKFSIESILMSGNVSQLLNFTKLSFTFKKSVSARDLVDTRR